MFGLRTPTNKLNVTVDIERKSPQKAGPSTTTPEVTETSKVRRSIGEWETVKATAAPVSRSPDPKRKAITSPKKATALATSKPKPKTGLSHETKAGPQNGPAEVIESSPTIGKTKYIDRLTEAKACVTKAKLQLGSARNLKTEIRIEVTTAIDRLFQLVKEVESVKGKGKKETVKEPEEEKEKEVREREDSMLIEKLTKHLQLIEENNEKMDKLRETIEKHQESQERLSYACVAATSAKGPPLAQTALHSVVVTAKDETETGEEVLNRIRKVVNAKEGGIAVEKIRKAKDRKVIVGCKTEEEREKIKERLKREEKHLNVEEIRNKDPLVILRDVLSYNSDEDVLKALKNQNPGVFEKIAGKDTKIEIAFKKRTRNPHTQHVVMRVSPKVWQHLIRAETVKIDLQRVRVADQSPLVQCSLCLGYGHGRRFCKETVEKCSHCGGPHMKTECADWLADAPPACCNCKNAKLDRVEHNAFSNECAIRRKWEAIARAAVAYQC